MATRGETHNEPTAAPPLQGAHAQDYAYDGDGEGETLAWVNPNLDMFDADSAVPRRGAGEDSQIDKTDRHPTQPPNYLPFEVVQVASQPQGVEVLGTQLGFPARSVMCDNLTPQWVYLRNARRYVAPYTLGVIFPILDAAEIASCRFEVPPGTTAAFVQPAANVGSRVLLQYTENELSPSSGTLLQSVGSLPA
jgi:hypothetical protein